MSDPPNPYDPPNVQPALRTADASRGTLLVDVERKIPPSCLKCGAKEGIVRREQDFSVVSPTARGFGFAGGVAGASVASVLRHDSSLLVPVLTIGGALVAVFSWILHKTATRVHLALPLCGSCNKRWTQGETIRRGLVATLGGVAIALVIGFGTHSTPLLVGAGLALVAAFVVAIPAKLPQRFVGVERLDGRLATLTRVSPEAAVFIETRLRTVARERKARATARDTAPEKKAD
jgi:hypothetical protein